LNPPAYQADVLTATYYYSDSQSITESFLLTITLLLHKDAMQYFGIIFEAVTITI